MHEIYQLEFIPNSLNALKKFQENGYLLIIITNQSGIGRNYFSIEDYHKFQKEFLKKLKEGGIKISKTYFCPHIPDDDCEYRKPKTRFIEDAVREFSIDLSKSWIIGDKISDILLSKDNELRSILISN
jgi:histidinol-phosphate phosphatase family protein